MVVPQKENRVNASQLYKGGDEETPNNILQVRRAEVQGSAQLAIADTECLRIFLLSRI